eukprot:TRINITY_DN13745_c0_g1_i1.p1 TRINITY_DN13745_c0_g1~~TRINITY_DN13745_c0_g1_i1.p1  ORF type:complete len:235 (-),score=32.73 TRINITY_DN13745_c0_g1_i1:74-778(-)
MEALSDTMQIDSQFASTAPYPADAVLISQGAEARVYACSLFGRPTILKERFPKQYRHPELDKKLTQSRVNNEARMLARFRRVGIDTPTLYFVDLVNSRIFMERVDGVMVKDFLFSNPDPAEIATHMASIGKTLGRLHAENFVHGDLTTSNMMIRRVSNSLVLIDYGLTFQAYTPEDKAVDLYVLERAFISTHPQSESLFELVLQSYGASWQGGKEILKRLKQVRARGRKKVMLG